MTDPVISGSNPDPVFPPLLTGHQLSAAENAHETAVIRAASSNAGAGDVFWSGAEDVMDVAIVLEPDVKAVRAVEMLYTIMVAFGDSFGALAPAELGLFYHWPGTLMINAARTGQASISMPKCDVDATPDWLVVSVRVDVFDPRETIDTGHELDRTCLWNEGCGDLTSRQLIDSFARHCLTWIHTWSEEGFKPVQEAWFGRAAGRDETITVEHGGDPITGTLTGLDENGNLLVTPPGGSVQMLRILDSVDWR